MLPFLSQLLISKLIFFLMMFQKKSKTYRTLKADLALLEDQVNRSRVAVENITPRPIIRQKCQNDIDNLKNELQTSINNINKETAKNKLLEELVLDMKGRLVNFQSIKKREEELKRVKKDKEILQFQRKIAQILKKHNEEIAKINNLKQQASSRRSQRVVFSNLFRKLQKQVAQHEQIYKQQLLIGEETRRKLDQVNSKIERAGFMTREPSLSNRNIQNLVNQNYQYSQQDSGSATYTFFMQSQKNGKIGSKIDTKFHSIRSSKHKERDLPHRTYSKEQKLLYTKELLRGISEITNKIQKIKIYTQTGSFQDLIQRYTNLEKQNTNLASQIKTFNQKILSFQEKTTKVIQQQKKYQFQLTEEEKQEQINPFELLGFQIKSMKLIGADQEINTFVDMLEEIGELLALNIEKNEKNIPDLQSLKLLDERISLFGQEKKLDQSRQHKESKVYSDSIVCCILEKMQKFGTCEKIFDDKLLRQEYYKQLGTRKQIKSRKMILK